MNRYFYILTLLFFPTSSCIAQNWEVVPKESKVSFKIKNAGINAEGFFGEFAADIKFDLEHLENGHVRAIIKTESIDTGVKMRDRHIKEIEYLNCHKFPEIVFNSMRIIKTSDGKYLIEGNLTIKDVTKKIKIPYSFAEYNGKGTFKGSMALNRRDFGVGDKSWTLSDDLVVEISLVCLKINK
jgi:polyisoprenoid-binding protein YceI